MLESGELGSSSLAICQTCYHSWSAELDDHSKPSSESQLASDTPLERQGSSQRKALSNPILIVRAHRKRNRWTFLHAQFGLSKLRPKWLFPMQNYGMMRKSLIKISQSRATSTRSNSDVWPRRSTDHSNDFHSLDCDHLIVERVAIPRNSSEAESPKSKGHKSHCVFLSRSPVDSIGNISESRVLKFVLSATKSVMQYS